MSKAPAKAAKEAPAKEPKTLSRSKSALSVKDTAKEVKPAKSPAASPSKAAVKEVPIAKKAASVKKLPIEKLESTPSGDDKKSSLGFDQEDIDELKDLIKMVERTKVREFLQKAITSTPGTSSLAPDVTPRDGKGEKLKLAVVVKHEASVNSAFKDPIAAFKKFNKNGSGLIDALEFSEIMSSLGMPMSEEMARITITGLIDKNGDGVVDIDEFISWYEAMGAR